MIVENKKSKVVAILVAAGIAIGGTGFGIYSQDQEIEKLQVENTKLTKELEHAVEQVETSAEKLREFQLTTIEMENKIKSIETKNQELLKGTQILREELDKYKPKQTEVSRGVYNPMKNWVNFISTAYVSFCDTGCTGYTATGEDVRKDIFYNGMRIIAVDPSVIPLYSIVELNIDGKIEKAIALDKGAAIKGHKIDYLIGVNNTRKAFQFGKKSIKIRALRWGKDGY